VLALIPVIFLGWAIGMLINYICDVVPNRRSLVAAFCLACDSQIPALNYLIWPRRCPHCNVYRSKRVWLVEIAMILATLLLWSHPPSRLSFTPGLVVLSYFCIVAVIDLEHRLILHPISLVGCILGISIGIWLHGWKATIIGGLTGFGIMLALYLLGSVFAQKIIRRKRPDFDEEPLGFGDVILSGVLGLFVGWPGIILCLITGILIAGVGILLYLLLKIITRRYKSLDVIPYGPFLLAGAFVLLFFRDHLLAIANP
jgi:leader peptidase (prepilin peptidase)/N-methyltransferase